MIKKFYLIVYLIFLSMFLLADDDHYFNLFIGDRAAGMSGAYTAIADGPEGAYYNPAGIAFSPSKYFSLSANAIQYKMLAYRDIYPDADKEIDYVRHSFSFVPNFFGFIQKARHFTFAITISSPDNEFFDQRDKIEIPYKVDSNTTMDIVLNYNFNRIDMTYDGGVTFGFPINPKLAVGFSTFFMYKDTKTIIQSVQTIKNYDYYSNISSYDSERIFYIKPQVGIQWMPIKQLSFGYNAVMSLAIFGVFNRQSSNFRYIDINNYDFDDNINIKDNTVSTNYLGEDPDEPFIKPAVLKQAVGVAWFINKSLLLSTDFYLYIPVYYKQGEKIVITSTGEFKIVDHIITPNVAIGFEWYITPNFPLRTGFFTNLSNRPRPVKGRKNQADYVNMFGGSLSIGYATTDLVINLGTAISFGRGQAQILKDQTDIQNLDALSAIVFISGGYQF